MSKPNSQLHNILEQIQNKQDQFTDSSIRVEIDNTDEESWYKLLSRFTDVSLFQTWAYGIYQALGKNSEHLVFKIKEKVVAVCQVKVLIVPIFKRGIAHIYWGPLWKLYGEVQDSGLLRDVLLALHTEYVIKRKLMLRIIPNIYESEDQQIGKIFEEAGFKLNLKRKKNQTVLLDLSLSPEELKKTFRPNWRRDLNGAERKHMEIITGTGEDLFSMFKNLYSELLTIKSLPFPSDMNKYFNIQKRLPENFKMQILICKYQGSPVAGVVIAKKGDDGLLVFSAANIEGRKLKATFLLHWLMIIKQKEMGGKWFDLGGVDVIQNPGCYRFKSGMGGKFETFIGQYESCRSISSRILVNSGEYIQKLKQKIFDFKFLLF